MQKKLLLSHLCVFFSILSREKSQYQHRLSTMVGATRGNIPGYPLLFLGLNVSKRRVFAEQISFDISLDLGPGNVT